jgi:nicotinamide phosphoribosyltransferase
MDLFKNLILNADSYKYSQPYQYPPGTELLYSYIESRGGKWDETVFFGLQMFLKEYMSKQITQEDIVVAEEIITAHGEPFYRELWEYILKEHNGWLPVVIKAVPEGTVVPTKNVLVTIEPTDPKCWWLSSFLETALLRAVWFPTTVCTNSYVSKRIILEYLHKTGTPELIDFKLHDFGFRGVSSYESAGIGGAAHLVNFKGTDTVAALLYARKYYDAKMAGFSIPASEHSTVTSWGRENEVEAYRNMLKLFGKPGAVLAVVSDSYNIYDACSKLWGTELKEEVINSGANLVIRPDSGDPPQIVAECLRILDEHFGHTINDKGYKVLNNVSVIQGDGINQANIDRILYRATTAGFSADNITFGQGGGLLQQVDRDTLKFAMKCSAAKVNGEWRDVYKQPITDFGKESKKGRVTLYKTENGFVTDIEGALEYPIALQTVYENGQLHNLVDFETVRNRVTF